MQLVPTNQMRSASTAWSPVQIQLDIAVRPNPGDPELMVITQRMQLPTSDALAGAQAAMVQVKGWENGAVVYEKREVGSVWAAERRQAVAVRNALLGSSFLRDSKPVTTTEPLPVGTMRITVTAADGTRRAFTSAAGVNPPQGLAGLDAAAAAYFELVFPDQG